MEEKKNYLKSFFSLIWKALGEKGKFTTVIGLAIIVSAVVDPLIKHNQGIVFKEDYMWQILWFVLSGIILIILPSEISISRTDGFKIKD